MFSPQGHNTGLDGFMYASHRVTMKKQTVQALNLHSFQPLLYTCSVM